MKFRNDSRMKFVTGFIAGQIVMLVMVFAFRPTAAGARIDGESMTLDSVFIRKGSGGAGIQISAIGAGGGPGISFFDAAGASRMQLSLDSAGRPTVLLRGKAGDVAIGVGIQADERPAIAVRGPKGGLVTLPVPDK